MVAVSPAIGDVAGVVVVGLPRGGVPVAAGVADALRAPLDIVLVRKLGVPGHRELAMGAIGEGGAVVWNDDLVHRLNITERHRARSEEHEREELERRARAWQRRPAADRRRRQDRGRRRRRRGHGGDGAGRGPGAPRPRRGRVVLAAPVGPPGWDGAPDFDATIIDDRPFGFIAVGQHYVDFDEVPDADVVSILERHR